jgi:copper chaperone CopZ
VRVAVRKIPGVESVEVSLEQAVTKVRLKPGNIVTLSQLRKIVKSGGFNSGAADIDVVGTLVTREGTPTLLVTGTSESFRLVADAQSQGAFQWVAANIAQSAVLLVGRVEAGETLVVRQAGKNP